MQISVVLDRHRDETDLTDLWKLETSGFHLGPFEVLCVGRVQLVITYFATSNKLLSLRALGHIDKYRHTKFSSSFSTTFLYTYLSIRA